MSIIHFAAATMLGDIGEEFVMVAGNVANDSGYQSAPALGTLVPLAYDGIQVIRVAWGLSAQFVSVGLFQVNPGDIGLGRWDTIEIQSTDANWNGHVIVEALSGSQGNFAGEFRWNQLPAPPAAQPFQAGVTYNLLWKP